MATQEILVPDIGSDEADVIEVLVKPGQPVAVDDPVVVLESAKASMEVPCTVAGVVKELRVQTGQKVQEGSVLLLLETAADDARLPVGDIQKDLLAVSETLSPAAEVPRVPASAAGAPEQTWRVPDIGSETADVIEVLVTPGSRVEKDQPIVVLESDKASMEVPAESAGVVAAVSVKVGDKVGLGAPLLTVVADATTAEVAAGSNGRSEREATAVPAATDNRPRPPVAVSAPAAAASSRATVHAGPAVRKLARELGADLGRVSGTGPRQRILKEDVLAWVKHELGTGSRPAESGNGLPALPETDFARFGEIELQALTRIQKLSAQNLHRAWLHIPHVTQFDEADITGLETFRVAEKEALKARGINLTILAFLVKACAHVIRQMPRFGSSLSADGESLVMKKYVHIGVAVDTPNGLVVPVVRDADRKSVGDIAKELGELSGRAREKKLAPADMQGATFTISSLGGIGGTAFTPIVNWPEVAILGVSRASQKPVWDGSTFQPRLMLPLSLSYDHRVIDGADAARFTMALAKVLSDIRHILL